MVIEMDSNYYYSVDKIIIIKLIKYNWPQPLFALFVFLGYCDSVCFE